MTCIDEMEPFDLECALNEAVTALGQIGSRLAIATIEGNPERTILALSYQAHERLVNRLRKALTVAVAG